LCRKVPSAVQGRLKGMYHKNSLPILKQVRQIPHQDKFRSSGILQDKETGLQF
jgi:hypothetical protein